MANLAKCLICGEKYNYCPSCAGTHAWKFYTDTHEHYQIYMIIDQYNSKVYSKDDARIAFENIGITADSDLSNLKPSIAEQIKNIVTVEKSNEEKTVLKKTKKSKLYND
jgi:hypothetical protein